MVFYIIRHCITTAQCIVNIQYQLTHLLYKNIYIHMCIRVCMCAHEHALVCEGVVHVNTYTILSNYSNTYLVYESLE